MNKDGKRYTEEGVIRFRWTEHFTVILNISDTVHLPDAIENLNELDINTDPPTEFKIEKEMKKGKRPGLITLQWK